MNVAFSPDNNDNAGWAEIGSTRPSAASLRAAIEDCTAASSIDDITTLNNGAVASAAQALAGRVEASTDTWDPAWGVQPARSSQSGVSAAAYGRVTKGLIIVFDDPSNCAATKYNGTSLDVTGYMQVAIYDVDTKGAAGSRKVRWHSYCEMSRGRGGGGWYGARVHPSLAE